MKSSGSLEDIEYKLSFAQDSLKKISINEPHLHPYSARDNMRINSIGAQKRISADLKNYKPLSSSNSGKMK